MNVLFFLRPKNSVAYVFSHNTLRQAIEKMKHHSYTALPVIDQEGRYIGTVTEGDFLWKLTAESAFSSKAQECFYVGDILRRDYHPPVNINASIEDLLLMAMNQNFVPVVDDIGSFIGIVTRRDVMQYYYRMTHDENFRLEPLPLKESLVRKGDTTKAGSTTR